MILEIFFQFAFHLKVSFVRNCSAGVIPKMINVYFGFDSAEFLDLYSGTSDKGCLFLADKACLVLAFSKMHIIARAFFFKKQTLWVWTPPGSATPHASSHPSMSSPFGSAPCMPQSTIFAGIHHLSWVTLKF